MKSRTLIMLIAAFIVILAIFGLTMYFFDRGGLGPKYSREQLVENFIQNENDFLSLEKYFERNFPDTANFRVRIGFLNDKKVSFYLFPVLVSNKSQVIGGNELEFNSQELMDGLTALGWSVGTLKELKDQLQKVNCNWISNEGGKENRIEVYPTQSGWGKFIYCIYKRPITDSMVTLYGRPLSHSEFGRRVVLNYTSIL